MRTTSLLNIVYILRVNYIYTGPALSCTSLIDLVRGAYIALAVDKLALVGVWDEVRQA